MTWSIFQNKNQKTHSAAKKVYEALLEIWREHADGYSNALSKSKEEKLIILERMIAETESSDNFTAQDINKDLDVDGVSGYDKMMLEMHTKVMTDIENILNMNNIYSRLTERYRHDSKILEEVIEDWYQYIKMISIVETGGRGLIGVTDKNAQLDIMRAQADASVKKDEIKKRLMNLFKK